ncbi:amino acid transporter [Peribacillus saganii]|uniref:Amino acid transporter n=1 Tax=Peribacillus saganii TaxID=2303992 RepID=A0A372LSA9_9BACI|nr:LysE family transporter [Peribacillus saganii]RFU70682.1 amino acid transporter [Peribacillus saganii]
MSVLIGYVFLGLSLAAPIGPINAAQLDKGIKNGFMHAWILGLGAALADAIYMALVYFGVVYFLETPFMKTFLWLFGFFVLCYTGVESIMSAGKIEANRRNKTDSLFKSFFSGFLMSLSNPLTILFWLGIYGSVLANAANSYDFGHLLLYSGAIFSGILIWDITMACVASSFRRFLTSRILALISVISGLSLIGFGIFFGYQAYKVLVG